MGDENPKGSSTDEPPKKRQLSLIEYPKVAWRDRNEFLHRPCVRNTFLYAIAGGSVVGATRFVTTKNIMKSCNWAVGSFLGISALAWFRCQSMREEEKRKAKLIIDHHSKLVTRRRQQQGEDTKSLSSNDSPSKPS